MTDYFLEDFEDCEDSETYFLVAALRFLAFDLTSTFLAGYFVATCLLLVFLISCDIEL